MGKNFPCFDVIQRFILVVMVNIVIIEITKAKKVTQAVRKEVNVREVENNTFAAIFLR